MELLNIITELNNFLDQYFIFRGLKFVEGIVLVLLGLNILVLLYILIGRDNYYGEFSLGHKIPNIFNSMFHEWNHVLKMVKSDSINRQKKAIIEAGDMVYKIFNKIGYDGDSLMEQLNGMFENQVANISGLKEAAKIKDEIVRDPEFPLSSEIARETVKTFGEALAEQETISEVGL